MWAPNDKRWLFFFTPFLLFVVGLLLWLHLFGVPRMEGEFADIQYDGVTIAEGAPAWYEDQMGLMDVKLPEVFRFPRNEEGLIVEHGTPSQTCDGELDGEKYTFPCKRGHVTVVLWDEKLASCLEDSCEAGVAFFNADMRSCTIMVPAQVEDALPVELMTSEAAPELPPDIEALLGAHEWVHCRRGSEGHISTPIFGPFVSIPTGHLMHPNLLKLGWRTEGLEGAP